MYFPDRFPLERCLRHNGTGLDHLAIRIEEINNQSISVYGINKDRWTADGFIALPDEKVCRILFPFLKKSVSLYWIIVVKAFDYFYLRTF